MAELSNLIKMLVEFGLDPDKPHLSEQDKKELLEAVLNSTTRTTFIKLVRDQNDPDFALDVALQIEELVSDRKELLSDADENKTRAFVLTSGSGIAILGGATGAGIPLLAIGTLTTGGVVALGLGAVGALTAIYGVIQRDIAHQDVKAFTREVDTLTSVASRLKAPRA